MQTVEQPFISVRDLKTYFFTDEGVVRAVDGATFDISRGKTLGVVGESGCGKSVAARSILRIVERPGKIVGGQVLLHKETDNGKAAVDLAQLGDNSLQMRQIRGKDIALIFQEPMTSFSPVHTVGDQIIEMIRLHSKMTKAEARDHAIEMLRLVGIPRAKQRVDEYSYQLSGGLRQRAMIAMALSCNPGMLIADEPTTALDVTTQSQILDLIQRLQAQHHMAVMLITHNLGVVAEMCDEVVVMYLGRVVEQGPVDAIFHNAKHPYTQALLRSIPSINSESRVKLPTITGTIPHPYNRPMGCPFHPRCPSYMKGVCEANEPKLELVAEKQSAACFLYPGA